MSLQYPPSLQLTVLGIILQKPKPPQRRVTSSTRHRATSTSSTSSSRGKTRERRKKSSERRHSDNITQFPIITTQGICVRKERRKIPERRMSNIVVKETVMNEEVFETLFSNYLAYKARLKLNKKLRN